MAFEGGDGAAGGEQGATGGAADLLGGGTGADAGAGAAATGAGADGAGGGGGAGGDGQGGGGFEFLDKLAAAPGDGETSSNRDWVTSKGFKDLDSLVKSARHSEKAIHDKGMVAVPKEGAKPEEIAAYRAAIGVPDKPEGYEIKAPDGVQLNEPLIKALSAAAVQSGIPKVAFESVVGEFIKLQTEETQSTLSKQYDEGQTWFKDQGGKAVEQRAHIQAAQRVLGLSVNDINGLCGALTTNRAFDLLAKLGSGMAEDTLITGGKGRFGVTGAQAQTTLDSMKADPDMMKKVMTPGTPERAHWDRLNQAAAEWKAAKDENL